MHHEKQCSPAKEIRCTHSPGWPVGETLVIREVTASDATNVTLLGSKKKLAWRCVGDTIEIDLANIGIHDLPCEHVFVFKITGSNRIQQKIRWRQE